MSVFLWMSHDRSLALKFLYCCNLLQTICDLWHSLGTNEIVASHLVIQREQRKRPALCACSRTHKTLSQISYHGASWYLIDIFWANEDGLPYNCYDTSGQNKSLKKWLKKKQQRNRLPSNKKSISEFIWTWEIIKTKHRSPGIRPNQNIQT